VVVSTVGVDGADLPGIYVCQIKPNQVIAINLGVGEFGYWNDGVGVEGVYTNNYD